IDRVAKEFAAQPKALAIWAIGQPDNANGIYNQLAFAALNALKGNLKANGLVSIAPGVALAALPPVHKDEAAEEGSRRVRFEPAKSGHAPFRQYGLYEFLESVRTGSQYPIEMLLVHECNPLYS